MTLAHAEVERSTRNAVWNIENNRFSKKWISGGFEEMTKQTSNGKCGFCNATFPKAAMTKHLKSCKKRNAALERSSKKSGSKKDISRIKLKGERHYFFLNPYNDIAFTSCPKCEEKTKIRKNCLVIHIEPKNLFSLNKSCRYCSECDLIIVKQVDLEGLLAAACERYAPEIIGNEYFVFGTMDRKDWKDVQTEEISSQKVLKRTYSFKDAWKFEVRPAGWYFEKR